MSNVTTQAEVTPSDILAILTRIAQALEKQNELTEELTSAISGVSFAIQDVGANL